METPQSMLEDPSSGSKTTQYLHNQNKLIAEMLQKNIADISNFQTWII